jgi:hypothetical protein
MLVLRPGESKSSGEIVPDTHSFPLTIASRMEFIDFYYLTDPHESTLKIIPIEPGYFTWIILAKN